MDEFWKIAIGIAGIGAIGSFVFYSLYKQWLKVEVGVFANLTPEYTYKIFRLFLILTFLFAVLALGIFAATPSSHARAEQSQVEVRAFTSARFANLLRIIDAQLAFFDSQKDAEGRKLAENLKAAATTINDARNEAINTNNMIAVLLHTNELVVILREYQRIIEQRYDGKKADPAVSGLLQSNVELSSFRMGLERMTLYAVNPSIKDQIERAPFNQKLLEEYMRYYKGEAT